MCFDIYFFFSVNSKRWKLKAVITTHRPSVRGSATGRGEAAELLWGLSRLGAQEQAGAGRAGAEGCGSRANAAAIRCALSGKQLHPSPSPGTARASFACECPAFLGGRGRAGKNLLYSEPGTTQGASRTFLYLISQST